VRKIIQFCNQLQEYLTITEAIQSIEDLVVYVRNLTPIMTRVAKEVEQREQELTNQRHRELLIKHLGK
jgi:vinculin